MAGDISNPRRTFLVVIAVLVPATVLFNSAPLMVALSIDSRRCNSTGPNNEELLWQEGYFGVVVRLVFPVACFVVLRVLCVMLRASCSLLFEVPYQRP